MKKKITAILMAAALTVCYAAGWHIFLYSAVGRSASARGHSGDDTGTHARAFTGERGGN